MRLSRFASFPGEWHCHDASAPGLYETMKTMHGHPSPEEVYARLKKKVPAISLATVYKNIHIFVESCVFREVSMHHGSVRVEMNGEAHHHVVCSKCRTRVALGFGLNSNLASGCYLRWQRAWIFSIHSWWRRSRSALERGWFKVADSTRCVGPGRSSGKTMLELPDMSHDDYQVRAGAQRLGFTRGYVSGLSALGFSRLDT